MTDTIKDQLIISQSMKIFNLEMKLAECDVNRKNAARGQLEYKEILHDIGQLLHYDGNYGNLIDIIKDSLIPDSYKDSGVINWTY